MTQGAPIVYLVDDDRAVLRAVDRLLRAEGWRTAAFDTPERFLEEHDPARPGCVVIDLAMPRCDGHRVHDALVESGVAGSPRPVIFLTGRAEVPDGVRAMKRGAVDFLMKPVDDEQLLDAVRRAIELDRRTREATGAADRVRAKLARLTPREREVMSHVVAGRLNKQIAAAIGISEKTVKVHRGRVMLKMEADSLAELVQLAGSAWPGGVPPTDGTKVQ